MKRGAAEMEGGAGDEEEGEDEEEEGDAEEEGEEEEGEEDKERRRGHQEEGEDAEEEEMGDAEDNMEEEVDEHHTPRHASTEGPFSKKEVAHSDDEEDERSGPASVAAARAPSHKAKGNEDDEEEHPDIDFAKSQTADTSKLIGAIMAQFTSEQTSRFECYRRSNFQKSNMRRLLQSVAGCPISMPMTIVMSGIAKMFVGELVETARTVMTERKETGPTRPCHIREAYRRLKLKGKVPLRSRPRLFH